MSRSRRDDLVALLDGSFDAGFLISESGDIRHANEAARDLFSTSSSSLGHVDSRLEFSVSRASNEVLGWNEVATLLLFQENMTIPEWTVTATKKKKGGSKFHARAKITLIDDEENQQTHSVIFLRPFSSQPTQEEDHPSRMSGSSVLSAAASITQPSAPERTKKQEECKTFDSETDPMFAIDEAGTILMFNQAAVQQVDWCRPELVGENMSLIGWKQRFQDISPNDPMFAVDEEGIILMFNRAAVESFDWCQEDLVGEHVSQLGGGSQRSMPVTRASFPQQPQHHRPGRRMSFVKDMMDQNLLPEDFETPEPSPRPEAASRTSPQVFRIYICPSQKEELSHEGAQTTSTSFTTESATPATAQKTVPSVPSPPSDELMSATVEASFDPIFQISDNGIIQMVNHAACRMFGWSREEFRGNNISMILSLKTASSSDSSTAAARDKEAQQIFAQVMGKQREVPGRKKDGTEFHMELGVAEMNLEGERLYCTFVHDLTGYRKRLQKRERLTAALMEASSEPMFQINEYGIIKMVNNAAVRQFKWSRKEFTGSNISMICGGTHGEHHDEYIARYLKTGEARVVGKKREFPARRKDGSEFPIEMAVAEVKTNQGEERLFCGCIRNLTNVKREQSISRGIIEGSLDPMLLVDEDGIILMVNAAAIHEFGWIREEFVGSDIRMIAGLEYADVFKEKKHHELPVRRKDGTVFPVELGVVEIKTDSGEKLFCETIHDLTQSKKEESFRSGVIESILDPLFQINEHGIIQLVNEAAIKQFGWSREEFMGNNISMIAGGAHWKYHDKYLERYLGTGDARVIGKKRELPARRKDGTEFRIELGVVEFDTEFGEERLFCGYVHDLTEFKKKERLSLGIIEASLDPLFQINERGIILMVNEAAVNLFGWRRTEFIGSNISIITGGKHAANHDNYIRRYLETGETRVIGKKRQLPACKKDGTEFQIELGVVEIKTETDEERLFCGFVRDLSDVKRKERVSVGIIESSLDPMFQINDHGVIQMVNEAAVNLFGWSREEFMGSNIRMIAGGGHGQNHDNYIRHYLETGISKVIGKRRELPARRKDGSEFPVELGVIEVETSPGEERLFCGFVRDLSDVKRKERISVGIIESSLDPMFQINEHGIIQMVNEAAVKNFGWSREEFMGSNISMIAGGGHMHNHDKYIRKYLETGIAKVIGKKRELPARKKDGSKFRIELGVTEIKTDSGEERLFCGFVRDLSNVKRKERISVGIIESSLDPMFQINEHGIIQMVNEAAVKRFGWSREEFMGSNISIIAGGGHAKNHDKYIQHYLETGISKVIGKKRELPARGKDGSEFPIELGVVEVKRQHGEERMFCGYVHDVSSRIKKQNLLAGTAEASLDPMFQINKHGSIEMVNSAAIHMFGWSRDEFLGNNISMICGGGHGAKHDQYIQRYLETGEARIIGKKREMQAQRKDGSEFPIELGVTEIKGQGKERMFCGFLRDLTPQKAYEDELRRRESFTSRIIEAAYDALLVTDQSGAIQRVNAAATNKFGWTREQLCEQNIEVMFAPEYVATFRQEVERYVQTGTPMTTQREVEAFKADGTEFPCLIGARELEGPAGSHLFAIFVEDLSHQQKMLQIEIEKTAAEVLLLNMLPEKIAHRLRSDPSCIAEHYDSATILFADIVGFTTISSEMEPKAVVDMLNELFSIFDDLVDRYDLNKVKTIGDCYMVSSVPADQQHAESDCCRMCNFACDMMEAVGAYNEKHEQNQNLSLRVGINTGPVVAGVVGTKRFLYDLWGDAVNVASRMESTGIPDRIQVTKVVVTEAGDNFVFESRGIVQAKGKGDIEAFLLTKRTIRPRVRRSSFFRQIERLKSFRERSFRFAGEPCQMDLYQSLRALNLVPRHGDDSESWLSSSEHLSERSSQAMSDK